MVITERISFRTKGHCDVIDVTSQVAQKVQGAPITSGTVTLFCVGSTGGLTTIEFESGAVWDFQQLFDRLAPTDIEYRHNLRWGDMNGYAHVRAALLGPSLTVPFVDHRLTLGTWQQIVFVDFDNRPRSRELVLQIMGE
jgi:secondary thiamine-phosphate synthase enzyme